MVDLILNLTSNKGLSDSFLASSVMNCYFDKTETLMNSYRSSLAAKPILLMNQIIFNSCHTRRRKD